MPTPQFMNNGVQEKRTSGIDANLGEHDYRLIRAS